MNTSMYLVLIESCCFNERQHDSTEFNRLVRKTAHSAQNLFFTGTIPTTVRTVGPQRSVWIYVRT